MAGSDKDSNRIRWEDWALTTHIQLPSTSLPQKTGWACFPLTMSMCRLYPVGGPVGGLPCASGKSCPRRSVCTGMVLSSSAPVSQNLRSGFAFLRLGYTGTLDQRKPLHMPRLWRRGNIQCEVKESLYCLLSAARRARRCWARLAGVHERRPEKWQVFHTLWNMPNKLVYVEQLINIRT